MLYLVKVLAIHGIQAPCWCICCSVPPFPAQNIDKGWDGESWFWRGKKEQNVFAQGLLTLSPSLSRPLSICCSLSPRFSHSLKGTLICCRQGKLPSLLARTGDVQMHVHNCTPTPTQTHGCTLIHKSHKHQHTHTNTRLYAYAFAPTHTHTWVYTC